MAWQAVAEVAKEVAPAVVGAGAGMLSQAVFGKKNWKRTKELNKQQYEYNKNLAEQAFQRNVQMWNAENAYNTPAAQMMRMRAAGLNPNLIYGNGQEASAGLAGDAPELQYGQYDPKINYFDPTEGAFQGINAAMSLRQINSMVDLQETQSRLNESESKVKELEAALKGQDFYWYDTKVASELAEQNSRTNLNKYMAGYYKSYTDYAREGAKKLGLDSKKVEKELSYFDALTKRSLELSAAEIQEINERTKNYPVQRAQIRQAIAEMAANIELMGHEGNLKQAQKDLTNEERQFTHQKVLNAITENMEIEKRIEAIGKSMDLTDQQINTLKSISFKNYVNAGTDIVGSLVDAGSAYATGGLAPRTTVKGFGK